MKDIEYILEFAVNLGSSLLHSGANLERANDSMYRVCSSYNLTEISIFSLSTIIQIGAKNEEGEYAVRQIAVPSMDTHMEKLRRLNQLSRTVCSEHPEPSQLMSMHDSALNCDDYNKWIVLLGRMLAMVGICWIFGGTVGDIIATVTITFPLYWIIQWLSAKNLNDIIADIISMIFAGCAAIWACFMGIGDQVFIIMITLSMIKVPGIPLVNAARNLLCGNEMNGILEGLKALIETLAIVLGLFISIEICGGLM